MANVADGALKFFISFAHFPNNSATHKNLIPVGCSVSHNNQDEMDLKGQLCLSCL